MKRIITEKEKRALLIALRTFMRRANGERIPPKKGEELINRLLKAGIRMGEYLHPLNYRNACNLTDNEAVMDAEGYVNYLINGEKILDLNDGLEGINAEYLENIAETVHDFFMELTGRGGTWNTDIAKKNLEMILVKLPLEVIMSEAAIAEAEKVIPEVNFYNYILSLRKKIDINNVLGCEEEPYLTEEESRRLADNGARLRDEAIRNEAAKEAEQASKDASEKVAETEADTDLYPEPEERLESGISLFTPPNPVDYKKDTLTRILMNYSVEEIAGLAELTPPSEDGYEKPLSEVIADLAEGRYDLSRESYKTREIHDQINSDLQQYFIDCASTQEIEMDEKTAETLDLLCASWDMRSPEKRKLQKLHALILRYGEDDKDLLDALNDIYKLYNN